VHFFPNSTKKRNNIEIRVDPCVLFCVEGFLNRRSEAYFFFLEKEGKSKQGLFSILNTIQRLGFKDYKEQRFC